MFLDDVNELAQVVVATTANVTGGVGSGGTRETTKDLPTCPEYLDIVKAALVAGVDCSATQAPED